MGDEIDKLERSIFEGLLIGDDDDTMKKAMLDGMLKVGSDETHNKFIKELISSHSQHDSENVNHNPIGEEAILSDMRKKKHSLLVDALEKFMSSRKKSIVVSKYKMFVGYENYIFRPIGRSQIYDFERILRNDPSAFHETKNHWDLDCLHSPKEDDIDQFIPDNVDLGVHDAFQAYGYVIMKNGQKRRVALKDGIPYLLPYAPFAIQFSEDAFIGVHPKFFYEVCYYYLKPFVCQQASAAVAFIGGQQALFGLIWRDLVVEYEFLHCAILETVTGRAIPDSFFARRDQTYNIKIGRSLLSLLIIINSHGRGCSDNLTDSHWHSIINNFGLTWRALCLPFDDKSAFQEKW